MAHGHAILGGDVQFYGLDCHLPPLFGGLGKKYLVALEHNSTYLHQVNPISGSSDTNAVIRARSIQVATEMQSQGIGLNDVIAICSRTHSDQTLVVLGALLTGASVAPIDPDWNVTILKQFINKLRPKMIFCDMRVVGYLQQAITETMESSSCKIFIFTDNDARSFKKNFLKTKMKSHFEAVQIADPKTAIAFIIPTQGTTKSPKLVSISHDAIYVQTHYMRQYCMPTSERVATFSSLSTAVQVVISCLCFEYAVTKVLVDSFAEKIVCKAIQDSRVDTVWLGCRNAFKLAHYEAYKDFNMRNFRSLFIIGSPVSAMDMVKIRRKLPDLMILECYNLTEMCFLVSCHNLSMYNGALQKPGSTGLLLEGIRCKIVDLNTNKSMGPNKWGELLLKGPSVMLNYYKDTDTTRQVFDNTWLKTGDGGQFDEDCHLYICGRISDLLNVRGKWIPPGEIEEIIALHPAIEEVTVIGMKDFLIACVVKTPDGNVSDIELMEYFAEKLPEHKRPQQIKFLQNLPKTHNGNVRRNELRELYLHIRIERVESVQESKSVGSRQQMHSPIK